MNLVCIIVAWLYALIWISLQFGTRNGFVLEGFLTTCTFDYLSRDTVTRTLVTLMIFGGFIIPVTILLVFFFLTKRCLEAKTKEMGKEHYVFTSSISKNTKSSFHGDSMRQNSIKKAKKNGSKSSKTLEDNRYSYHKRQFRVLRTIIINLIFFTLSWAPYAILTLLAQYGPNIEYYSTPVSTSIPALFAKTSSIYNPILYTLNNKDCKKFFKRIFCK